jgi:hypothetical protein
MFKYPAAPYAYLAINNIDQQRDAFLRGDIEYPSFVYGKRFSKPVLERRKAKISKDLLRDDLSEEERTYLERRLQQTEFLLTAAHLQSASRQEAEAILATYRDQISKLYSEPHAKYAEAIYLILKQAAKGNPAKEGLLGYIEQNTSLKGDASHDIRPSAEQFAYYRTLFAEHAPWLFDRQLCPETRDIQELITFALQQIGAAKHGWRIEVTSGISNVRVSYHDKKIQVGEHLRVRTRKRRLQVVCHEVYGHVGRNMERTSPTSNIRESEGFAVLLEQLLETKFSTKRALRYLTVAAGWGALGRPMDFRETFEIVWRAMVILSSYSEEVARHKAFHECVRAFRGGRPDVPGAVFTKDTAYFEGNVAVWNQLEKRILSKEEFVALLTGRELLEI